MNIIMSIVPFLIAKAHANHSKSPTQSQINSMITSERIIDVENILQNTGYGKLLNEVRPSVDLPQFEINLRREFARILHVFRTASDNSTRELLDAFAISIEATNMDHIFQAIIRNNVTEDLEKIIIPVGKFGMSHYRRIMDFNNVDTAVDLIVYPELKIAATKALQSTSDDDERIFLLSSAFSHAAYSKLGRVAPNWVKTEANYLNLETICRAVNLGIDSDNWLIPKIGSVYKLRKTLSNLNSTRDILTYMSTRMSPSRPLINALNSDDMISKLEDEVLQLIYYQRFKNFILYGNRKEAILDYFSIKKAEIEDISRILTSKLLHNDQTAELRRMIYPIYPI